MTHGIIKGKANMLGGEKEDIEDWRDEVVHYYSVGNMMYELYISPEILSPEEMDVLGNVTKWAMANAHPLLDNTTMVGGDPAQREPYGYVHSNAEKSIITLRNPFVRPRTMKLKIDEQNGFTKFEGTQEVTVVYPYFSVLSPGSNFGDTLSVDLQGYEQIVVETWPVPMTDTLMEPPTAPAPQPVFSPPTLSREANGLKVHVNLDVPAGAPRVRLAVLLEPNLEVRDVKADTTDAGKPLALSTENGGGGVWHWFYADLTPGKHSIELTIHSAAPAHLTAWLLTQRSLGDGHSGPVPRLHIDRGTHLLLEETIR
jgi:hypothetical protein